MARDPIKTPATPNAPLVIDTAKLIGAEGDPRGDNRPGVIPDQPAEEGINLITNLPETEMDPDGVRPGIQAGGPRVINEPVNSAPKPADTPAPKGKKIAMVVERDYWPRTRPAGMDPETDYRVRAGETVDLPSEEAMDVMEAGIGKRADRRA